MLKRLMTVALGLALGQVAAAQDDVDRLIGAMLGDTPVIADLQSLTDEIGGRVTGSPANEAAIEWALARFRHRRHDDTYRSL